MLLRYNLEKLEKVITDFYKLTGISIAITDPSFRPLVHCRPAEPDFFCQLIQSTPVGVKRCSASDHALLSACKSTKGTCSHTCHAGLTDTGVAITDKGVILGYVIFGQVYDSSRAIPRFSEIYPRIADLELSPEELEKAYNRILFVDKDTIESASELVEILTKYIWFEHMIHPDEGDTFGAIAEYIAKNQDRCLEVGALCRRFHLSRNALYRLFRQNAGCTVNEYVTAHRIEEAKQLLAKTSLTVSLVGETVGIDNYQYFCRIFKQKVGLSPLQYRKTRTIHDRSKPVLAEQTERNEKK